VEQDFDLLCEEYARYFGHDPDGSWILVVHADNSSELHRFDDVADMWCCRPDRADFLARDAAVEHKPPFPS
jgi:hypothetical protein